MNTNFLDITGKTFGKIKVIKFLKRKKVGHAKYEYFWVCKCHCGSKLLVAGHLLKTGNKRSCGCLRYDQDKEQWMDRSRRACSLEYRTWSGMKDRCSNPNTINYHNYGGRGIRVCDRWCNSFEAFLADMGPKPSPDYSIERIDNDGDYCPENCRWATWAEQGTNKRNNRLLTFGGKTLHVSGWAREVGVPASTILLRIKRGLPIETALGLQQLYDLELED